MAGVYGEFLGFFPELFEDFEVYRHDADVVSGYRLEYARTVRGIRQSNDAKATGWGPKTLPLVNVESSYILWTYEPVDMATEFVRIDGRMHRPMSESRFVLEGGFYETRLDMVAGNDGTKGSTPELSGGKFWPAG